MDGHPPAEAAPTWEQLRQRALELARRAGGPHGVTIDSLMEAASTDPAPLLDELLLEVLHRHLADLNPLPRLVLCLQLLRWISESKLEEGWPYVYVREAISALYDLGRLELFPLRLRLLDMLLAVESAPEEKADLLFRRGNTCLTLSSQAPALREPAIKDLRAAAEFGRASGHVLAEISAECALARAEFLDTAGHYGPLPEAIGQRVAQLEALLPRTEPVGRAGDVHEILAELERRRAEAGHMESSARAIHHARQAASLAPQGVLKATRLAALAEMLLLHGSPEEKASSVQVAREAVASLPPDAGDIHAAPPHAALGASLLHNAQAAEALGHLERALELLARQRPSANRNLIRLKLARALLSEGRPDDSRHQLELTLADAHACADKAALLEATQYLVMLDRQRGRDDLAEQSLRTAEAALAGTPGQTLLALERLRPRRHGEVPSAEFIEVIQRYLSGQLTIQEAVDRVLESSVANHASQLPSEIRRQLLQGERIIRDASIRAQLLQAEGRQQEALDELRRTLAIPQEPAARLNAAALLIALLPAHAREERLRWCNEVEALLEGPLDAPSARIDLANALWMCGREDPLLLERAWRHAELTAGQFEGEPHAVEVSARVRARIRLDQVSLRARESSLSTRELAEWFTQAVPLPEEELSGYRCHVAWCLLAPGPLVHPDSLALAERLLGLAPQSAKSQALRTRLLWLRGCLASPQSPPARPAEVPEEFRGSLDEIPAWIVALAQGERPQLDSALGDEERGMALAVADVRPDRAEAVLEWLVARETDLQAFDLLGNEVSRSSPNSSVKGLGELVEKMATKAPSYHLLRLRVAICRRLAADGDRDAYERAADALLAFASTSKERVEAKLSKGIERMDVGQMDAAHQVLSEALEEARRIQLAPGQMFPLLTSTGNAFRKGRKPDIERALSLYAEAEALGAPSKDEAARLWKVNADALLERGREGDAVKALQLLERALEVRKTGFLRAETLVSAAEAEQAQPGQPEVLRLRRALDRLEQAARYAEGHYQPWVASKQIPVLARLVRLQPKEERFRQRLEELSMRYQVLAKEVEHAKRGMPGPFPEDVVSTMKAIMLHPAGRACMEALFLLSSPDLSMVEELARSSGKTPAEVRQRIEQQHQQQDRSPRAIRKYADRLARVKNPWARSGATVGRARLLAYVAEHRLAQIEEVGRVAQEAEQLVRQMPDSEVKLMLLLELGHVWAPDNHYSHPVRDFRRAAELAREVHAAARSGGVLARQALQSLARSTRYRTDGDVAAHLREAERLYEQCVREYEAAGETDVAAHVRMNLAELRAARRAGNHLDDLQAGIDAARERLKEGRSPEQQAKAQLTLAVNLTMQGSQLPPPQGESLLGEARRVFESLDRSQLSTADLYSADNYYTICLADLATGAGRHQEAISLWRKRLDSLGPDVPEDVWAYTVHNLADMLLRPGSTFPQLLEGLTLSEQCLQVRTLERNPVHHWETCENIGKTVARLLLSIPDDPPLPSSLHRQVWEHGRKSLRGAFEAARRIGSYERLMQSASALLELSLSAPSVSTLESAAEEGWSALDEARPYLLLDEKSGFLEAHLSAEVAATLADRLTEGGLVGVSNGLDFVLSGERAEFVLRWAVRAVGAAQRRLAGRLARPAGVSHATWMEWLAAVRSKDVHAIGRALDSLRHQAPAFLRGEPDLEGTWSWLRSRPGSVAVAIMEGSQGLLATILTHDAQRRVLVAGLPAGELPFDEATVARSLTAHGPSDEYRSVLEWTRQHIVAPLGRLMPASPSQLLWVPTGVLRVLAPADLWPSVPVTCAARLDLETRPQPARPRRTLLAVADPGPGTKQSIPGAVEMGALMARMAQGLGPLRVRMSRGRDWGQALGTPCPELVEGPTSPEDILRELAEVDLAMLLCHGEVKGPREARLLLVDGSGALVPLEMERLAEDPRRVAGTTVVLLSCETGRVGDWLHQAAGLAGALLAGGARSVIAPLWPVLLDPALAVGNAVLHALAGREDVSVVLQRLHAPESGPALGGRSKEQRKLEQAWSLRGFVHWAG